MESLSRPFRRRKKLPSFSAYSGVFSAGAGVAPAKLSSPIEDYNEIFGGGSRSSIPVLDLSALDGAADVAGGVGKELDYSKIFGGSRDGGGDDDVADSFEEVFAQRTPAKKAPRSDGSTSPGGQRKERNQHGTPNQSVEGMKQYNTFYNRTSQGSKDGENGTTHVAHFRAVPGFTCFIDENIQKAEGDKLGPLPKDKMQPTPKVSLELDKKQAKDGTEKLKSQSSWKKLYSLDRSVDANGSGLKTHTFKLSSPTRSPASTTTETKRSSEFNFDIPKSSASKNGPVDCSPSFSDDELDVDSVAAVSAAALRKAVREAEASIRLAKEIMERKKNGFQKFPKPRAKEGLEMKKKNVEQPSIQATKSEKVALNLKETKEVRIAYGGVRETNDAESNSYDDVQEHIAKLERKKARRSGKLSPGLIQSAENCVTQNICGKGNMDKLEASVDFEAPRESPEMLKTDNHRTAALELEHPKGSNIGLFVNNVSGKVDENLETSAYSKAVEQFPDLVTTENQRKEVLEMGDTNGLNIMLSVHNNSGKVNEDMLKPSADSKPLGQFPELAKTGNHRTVNLESEQTNGDNVMPSVCNLCEKENKDKLEQSAESKALGQFPELVKTDKQESANSELGHTNDSNIMLSALGFSEKENEEILETFADSKELPELMKTDNQSTATLELGHTQCRNIMLSALSFSEKVDEEMLETSADSEAAARFPELSKTDDQGTAILDLEQKNGNKISSFVHDIPRTVNEDTFEKYAVPSVLEQFHKLVKTDNQRTATLELAYKCGNEIVPPVHHTNERGEMEKQTVNEDTFEKSHDIPRTVNEDTFEKSAVPSALEQFHKLVKTDNQRTATLELAHKCGSEIVPPVHHTIERGEMEKQTDEGTLELLERHSKEVHRKRKQWRDFEGKPSEIKIAEDGGQSRHNTIAQEVPGQEERTLEPLEGHNKEVHRKRRQWKDVEVKPCDIKIAGDEEKCINGQENREKAADVTSSSKESYEKEVVKSQEREKIEGFESLSVNATHGEELDEGQTWVGNGNVKECFKEPEIAELLMGVHEEKDSVQHMCKQDEIEKKLQEFSKWRDYEVAFEVESNESGLNEDNGTTDAWKENDSEHLGECQLAHKHDGDDNHISFDGSERMSDASQSSIDFKEDFSFDEEEVGETSEVFQSCEFNGFEIGSRDFEKAHVTITEANDSLIFNGIPENVVSSDNDSGDKQTEYDETDNDLANDEIAGIKASVQMQEENNVFDLEKSAPGKRVVMESRIEASQLPNLFKGEEKTRGVYEQEWVTRINRNEGKMRETDENEEKTAKESRQREVREEKEQLERNDEISKREREREKNRMVVERAIREARERAFAEARERAERAAVEKVTAEARERVMAEARQKFEKTNTATKSSTDKASLQAKLRSERAAVERAHAEARERALEKALSQKSNVPSSKLDGNNGESVARRNARLEKTQRTMERAAKALAEKNMRDLRAQREQAERHRLAETLDAEIKRWSSGKTGNLRALLSTLQYILGPDSGWQSVSLTEIVTTSAVKKAYRKATLHVHPDKLQQRGATIQQKYICEKVFDLLKAAWNRFNSEER